MDWQKILRLAKQGHPLAISILVNAALPFSDTASRAVWRGGQLELWLEAQHSPPPQGSCVAYLQAGFQKLAAPAIEQVQVLCYVANRSEIAWREVIQLKITLASRRSQPQQARIASYRHSSRSMAAPKPQTSKPVGTTLALAYEVSASIVNPIPTSLVTTEANRKLNGYLCLIKYLLSHRYLKYIFIIVVSSVSIGILWLNLHEIYQVNTSQDLDDVIISPEASNLWLSSVMSLQKQMAAPEIQALLEQELLHIRRAAAKQTNNLIPESFSGRIVSHISLDTPRKVIALTFDDGPWPNSTTQILRILEEHQIQGTFFLVGQAVKAYPNLVKTIAQSGHAIGNHSWSHPYHAMNPTIAASQIDRTTQIIEEITGEKSVLFRPPGGFMNNGLVAHAQKNNYAVVMWSADSLDYTQPSASKLLNNVLRQVSNGGIVLMHDGGGNRTQTVAALPLLIHELKQRHYQFVTIPELFHLHHQEKILGSNVWLGIRSLEELYALRLAIQDKIQHQIVSDITSLILAQRNPDCNPIEICLLALATVEQKIYAEEQARYNWHTAVNYAMAAAQLANAKKPTSHTWQESEQNWQAAIALLKQIPIDSMWRLRAQQKIVEYSRNHAVAKYRLEASQSQFIEDILQNRNLLSRTYLSICNLEEECRHHHGHLSISDPASLIKVPIALALVHQIKEGKSSWDTSIQAQQGNYTEDSGEIVPGKHYSLQVLMQEMINHSNNIATNQLIDHLGRETINQFLQAKGYRYSRVHSKLIGQVSIPKNLGSQSNFLSATELSKMMIEIYRSQDSDMEQLKQALQQQFDQEIGFKALSHQSAKWLGEKTGQTSKTLGTTLAFQSQGKTYILTLVSQSGQGEQSLRNVIQDIANYIDLHPF